MHKESACSPSLKALGKAIKAARKAVGMSQEAFAEDCGINRAYLSLVERGRVNISFENIEKISTVLKLKPSWLLDRAGL